jgi:peptidyl-dipeptidase A
VKRFLPAAALVLGACTTSGSNRRGEAQEFLAMYNDVDQRLTTVAGEAQWKASTDVTDQHTGERMAADAAVAAFRGSRYVIEGARKHLALRQHLDDIEFRQLDKILLDAAESPGTIPEIVNAKIQAEAKLEGVLNAFEFCPGPRQGDKCPNPVTVNQIDKILRESKDLNERRRYWEISKQTGPALKKGLAEVRDLRNRVAKELGYTSYFHLQVADYGMSVNEMIQLMDKTLADLQPLYSVLHQFARSRLAERYQQPAPAEMLPAHWMTNRWGQEWPGLVEAADLDRYFEKQTPEWIVKQGEKFYTSLGMPALPKSFWEKSDLYEPPKGSKRKKNTHASAWHINGKEDVRSLMNIVPDFKWFETAHHELGHVYYYIAYSNPRVPHVLREGMNRAFHEAVGDLISIAAHQQPYLRQIGILPESFKPDPNEYLLSEALDAAVVFLPWSAGTMTHFEYELYEKNVPIDRFNKRWWEIVRQYQNIEAPAERSEEFCDACTKTHIIDDAAQYYDYAMAFVIKYQLHDYIARKILRQDPHNCNYYGNKEVGKWLTDILSLGATRDWRQVIKEKTGEEVSSRAIIEYFKPLEPYLKSRLTAHK